MIIRFVYADFHSYGSIKSGPQAHLGKTDVCHLAIWYIFVNQSLAKTQKAIA